MPESYCTILYKTILSKALFKFIVLFHVIFSIQKGQPGTSSKNLETVNSQE